ncbi:MAG: invasion associated locus B family protein [Magnetococcales bacterium]|nr:invasion associated locus B family protein [Magnetococcales bacterium]
MNGIIIKRILQIIDFSPLLITHSYSHAVETSTRSFDDWGLRCSTAASPICEISQSMVNKKSMKKILDLFVTVGEKKNSYRARVIVPLGAWLQQGVTLSVGDRRVRSSGYLYCLPVGCVADLTLSSDMITAMKKANDGFIIIADLKQQQINFKISLKGFTKAFNGMRDKISALTSKK